MCGIAGIFWRSNPEKEVTTVLETWSKILKHRGPDGAGYGLLTPDGWHNCAGIDTPKTISELKNLKPIIDFKGKASGGFLHRRLSIIDLSEGGHQPMCDNSGRYIITYNGEIYNYRALRSELQTLGARFISQSDTEVVLYAYQYWGDKMLEKMDGMWAFVIFDTQTNRFFASRDRFGVKPFYFVHTKELFAFASEQKTFKAADVVKPEIRPEAVFDFFAFRHAETEEEGFLKNIYELKPGHSLTFSLNDWSLQKQYYYHISEGKDNTLSFDENVEMSRKHIVEAISSHTVADVAVGACLSGGLDSSAITGVASKLNSNAPFFTFTAVHPGFDCDEGPYAREVANFTNSKWVPVVPDPQKMADEFSTMCYALDLPLWSASTYAQFVVMRAASEHNIKVLLDGQGADELFAGYQPHLLVHHFQNHHPLNPLSYFNSDIGFKKLVAFEAQSELIHFLPMPLKLKLLNKKLIDFKYLNEDLKQSYKRRINEVMPKRPTTLKNQLANEIETSLKAYLRCEDRCSMWHSVESRTPFSSSKALIEFARTVPSSQLIQGNELKHLYRQSIKPFVPEKIYNRRDKLGFTTPNNVWIAQIYPQLLHLFNDTCSTFIDTKALLKDADSVFKRPNELENGRLFKLLAFAQWVNLQQ